MIYLYHYGKNHSCGTYMYKMWIIFNISMFFTSLSPWLTDSIYIQQTVPRPLCMWSAWTQLLSYIYSDGEIGHQAESSDWHTFNRDSQGRCYLDQADDGASSYYLQRFLPLKKKKKKKMFLCYTT